MQDIELDSTFFEHTLTMEQLNDLFPLSRICVEDPRRTRGLNKVLLLLSSLFIRTKR